MQPWKPNMDITLSEQCHKDKIVTYKIQDNMIQQMMCDKIKWFIHEPKSPKYIVGQPEEEPTPDWFPIWLMSSPAQDEEVSANGENIVSSVGLIRKGW